MHAYQKAGRLPALAPLQRHPACVRGYAPRMLLPLLSGGPSSLSCTRKYVSLLKNRKSERSTAHTHTRERVRRAPQRPDAEKRDRGLFCAGRKPVRDPLQNIPITAPHALVCVRALRDLPSCLLPLAEDKARRVCGPFFSWPFFFPKLSAALVLF